MSPTLKAYIKRERAEPLPIARLRTMVQRSGLGFREWADVRGQPNVGSLLGSHTGVVLLLESKGQDVGHFVLLLRRAGHVEYFDSFGLPPQRLCAVLGWNHSETTRFTRALERTRKKYKRIQAVRQDINVCGRYCVCRFNFKWASYEQFLGILHHEALTPDDVVTLLTLSTDLSHWESVAK